MAGYTARGHKLECQNLREGINWSVKISFWQRK